jgi:hypothetical protein
MVNCLGMGHVLADDWLGTKMFVNPKSL